MEIKMREQYDVWKLFVPPEVCLKEESVEILYQSRELVYNSLRASYPADGYSISFEEQGDLTYIMVTKLKTVSGAGITSQAKSEEKYPYFLVKEPVFKEVAPIQGHFA